MAIPRIITYVTLGSPYEQKVTSLSRSCEHFGLLLEIHRIPDLGGRDQNLAQKAIVCRDAAEEGLPFVFMDADAEFSAKPVLLDPERHAGFDLAATRNGRRDVRSGTVLYLDTDRTREVLHAWARLAPSVTKPGYGDQRSLTTEINRLGAKVSILPASYCTIRPDGRAQHGAVVVHHDRRGWMPKNEENSRFWPNGRPEGFVQTRSRAWGKRRRRS
ncbi:MAG: hypothetical protein H6739_36560 [Alphaproteobacteria bacterium]|nr:hypothetical protein [Alphaproteobacteria bacterium]